MLEVRAHREARQGPRISNPAQPIHGAENEPVSEGTETTSSFARIAWAILIAATLYVCYFAHLGAVGLVGPDEPRYAWIARDMAETGDWVTPRLYGKPWFEKPPLYYWGAAASFKLFGVSETTARLPSALCALLATLALGWLAWRVYGAETARWFLILLPTTVGMIGFSHAAATDMPFSAMLTIAMVCAAVVMGLARNEKTPILPRTPWLALILFGFFLGLAMLAKGPAAIILSGGGVFFWAIFTKRWRDAFRLLHPVAIAAFLATSLPWYIVCAQRNPDFFRVFIIEHNFKRFLTPEFQHIQPFWYYGPILLIAFLPWAGALIFFLVAGTRRLLASGTLNQLTLLLTCWAVFCLVFFTISKSKLPGYVLPAVPALGTLLVRALTLTRSRRAVFRAMVAAGATLLFAGILTRIFVLHLGPKIDPLQGSILSAVAVFLGCANIFLAVALNSKSGSNRAAVHGLLVGFFALLPILIVPSLSRQTGLAALSVKGVAQSIVDRGIHPEELRVLDLRRDRRYALNFYMHHEIPDWTEQRVREGYVLTTGKGCRDLKADQLCEDLWGFVDMEGPAWALLRVRPQEVIIPR